MNLREVYECLDEVVLNEYVSDGQEETLHLEFKTVTNSLLTNKEDRRNYAKALSGFANSDGGIVIWGIKTTKTANRPDVACEIVGVGDPRELIGKLRQHSGEFVSPTVDGIEHKIVGNCVVSIMPRSEATPHMAKAGEQRYFKRNGDSFYVMEHFDLEDMFGRRPKAQLQVYLCRVSKDRCIVGITNSGRATANAPYLAFSVARPWARNSYGLDGSYGDGMKKALVRTGNKYTDVHHDGAVAVHAGLNLDITALGLVMPGNDEMAAEPVIVDYLVSCSEMVVPKAGRLRLNQGQWRVSSGSVD